MVLRSFYRKGCVNMSQYQRYRHLSAPDVFQLKRITGEKALLTFCSAGYVDYMLSFKSLFNTKKGVFFCFEIFLCY